MEKVELSIERYEQLRDLERDGDKRVADLQEALKNALDARVVVVKPSHAFFNPYVYEYIQADTVLAEYEEKRKELNKRIGELEKKNIDLESKLLKMNFFQRFSFPSGRS